MTWQATHRITFAPVSGTLKHWLIMLCRDPYSADGLIGVTEDDFRKRRPPTWRYRASDTTWWWQGVPTPLWNRGKVMLQVLPGAAAEPRELVYEENRKGSGSDRFVVA